MHYTIIKGAQGWLAVYYTKDKIGKRVVFEVSDWHPSRDDLIKIALARQSTLVMAANNIGGRFQ